MSSKKKGKTADEKQRYKFNNNIDIEKLIQVSIGDLCDPDKSLKAQNFETDLQQIQSQVRNLEVTQRQINKIFSNCQNQLDNFKDSLEETEKAEEEVLQQAKVAAKAALQQPEITIVDSDDDDDEVQFIQKTYDADLPAKRQAAQKQTSAAAPAPTNQQTNQQQTHPQVGTALSQQQQQQLQQQQQQQVRQIDEARVAFSATLNRAGGFQTVKPVTAGQSAGTAGLFQKKPGQPNYSSSLANQEKMEQAFLVDLNQLKVGTKVLGQRQTLYDIWETATLMDILHGQNTGVPQRRYKVRFEGKKLPKTLLAKQTAFRDCINKPVTVGTRIVALYRDELNSDQFYAGVVAEAPNGRNELRYLVFFDDGYAQYCSSKEIHKVFFQSKQVWDDIHEDSQDFVKDYLAQYPERPMVRLHKGQTVKTEWKGKWWTARVEEVDASLVQMFFPADRRNEWIYRGSTRLEPLFTALANAEANRQAGKGKRHNLTMASARKPIVEYTRNQLGEAASQGNPGDKKKSTARKSTTPRASTEDPGASVLNTGQVWEAPWMKIEKKPPPAEKKPPQPKEKPSTPTGSIGKASGKDMASVLQERLNVSEDAGAIDLESLGTRLDQLLPMKDKPRKTITPHKCGNKCLLDFDLPEKFKGNNPLLIPLFCGWERHVGKAKPSNKRYITYRSPCGRRLRSINECDRFLHLSKSNLSIDYFCYDTELHVHYEFIPVKTFCDIKDISYGKENVAISCVNGIDRQYPDYVDYSNQRIPASGVKMNLDPDFLVCCDCTDNCRDRTKCRCIQLTVESSTITNGGRRIRDAGYKHRRLAEPLLSGVYECNPRCGCDKRCSNRVVQNGLQNRLQVFKTEKRGWGLRCLDDIPKGGFICIYAGQLLTDQGANEDGQQYGDEYLAELDYIEVVERQKEGYESDVTDIEDGEKPGDGDDYESEPDSDESFKEAKQPGRKETGVSEKAYRTRQTNKKPSDTLTAEEDSQGSDDLPDLIVIEPDTKGTQSISKEAETDTKKKRTGRSTAARFGNLTPAKSQKETITVEDQDDSMEKPSSRDFFSDDQQCYIMDAKSMGNIGRYLNHSCEPCAFVQNVFVDTHDLRFPWIAFFAGQYVSAGTELTWDYNYEVGSVPGKVLYCYCGSADCRGRLL